MKKSEITIQVGDTVNLFHAKAKINMAPADVYTVIKVGWKRIECKNHEGKKGFFAYHGNTHCRTYKKIVNEHKMVSKIVGQIDLKKETNKKHMYQVKRKEVDHCLHTRILREFGKSTRDNCQKTCDILNKAKDNFLRNKKRAGRIFFYFPVLKGF